jgi:hypothetical protein
MNANASARFGQKPLADALHQWMVLQRSQIPTAQPRPTDYSLRRWGAACVSWRRAVTDRQQLVETRSGSWP